MIPHDIVLKTPRCRLRKFSRADISFVFSASRYKGFCDGMLWNPPASEEDLLEPCEAGEAAWQAGVAYTFTIEKLVTAEPLGRIVIRHENGALWDVGFWTHPAQQGQGYLTEALHAVLCLGFEQLKAAEIQGEHATWNIASRRVMEKVGFEHIRRLPEGFAKGGAISSSELHRITVEQWRSRLHST
ncbi:MAG TPA: GNAT family protein [Chthoniobacteraceae bacterium]|jgi:ribosomal-protein-alanine N-acetyltransferase